ncbi:MAG TPA: DUF1015 domain-containing protein [Terriglobia bacterium]|nr:DUF1015 domain-containing protein [Terriglobia bacterium]
MADVRPFRGLRFNPKKVSIGNVVTQPYDKISVEMQDRYYAMDPHNIVRVILGRKLEGDGSENNVYTRAAQTLRDWRRSGVIEPMSNPAFVVCSQRFVVPGTGEERVRTGFIGLGRLHDYSERIVFPHERTLAGPKQDRLNLLRHTRAHFEQIFMLYEDPEQQIDSILDTGARKNADIQVTDEYGVTHLLWILEEPEVLQKIQNAMNGRKLIIADGHHRYETALAYRDEQRTQGTGDADAPHEWLPMTFFNMRSPALTVLPTHRVVHRLPAFASETFFQQASEFFDIETAPVNSAAFAAALVDAGRRVLTIGVATDRGTRRALLRLKPLDLSRIIEGLSANQRVLDVAVLHKLLIERCLGVTEEAVSHESNISYVREFETALKAVAAGAQVAFLLNPVRLDQMRDIVYEGNVMPQKSTDFYPKVLSGLVLYSLD